jgi:hypothetical protein
MDTINLAARMCSAGMFVGAALLGVHMALTHSTITAMVAYYIIIIHLASSNQQPAISV